MSLNYCVILVVMITYTVPPSLSQKPFVDFGEFSVSPYRNHPGLHKSYHQPVKALHNPGHAITHHTPVVHTPVHHVPVPVHKPVIVHKPVPVHVPVHHPVPVHVPVFQPTRHSPAPATYGDDSQFTAFGSKVPAAAEVAEDPVVEEQPPAASPVRLMLQATAAPATTAPPPPPAPAPVEFKDDTEMTPFVDMGSPEKPNGALVVAAPVAPAPAPESPAAPIQFEPAPIPAIVPMTVVATTAAPEPPVKTMKEKLVKMAMERLKEMEAKMHDGP